MIENQKLNNLRFLYLLIFLVIISCQDNDNLKDFSEDKSETIKIEKNNVEIDYSIISNPAIPEKIKRLLKVYPDYLVNADSNHIYWMDGTVMVYDDGKKKTHEELLDDPDIEDMLSQEYIMGEGWNNPPEKDFEPGRIRNETFFLKMYGENSSEVQSNLVNIKWVDGTNIKFNKINGASGNLEKVIEELKQLPDEYKKYLENPGGTFAWRNIAGTNRLSNHSFATAVDINTKYSDYWQWSGNTNYTNRIPMEIVKIFEKYGFIWGGKWYHYDTMHFEYRPELL